MTRWSADWQGATSLYEQAGWLDDYVSFNNYLITSLQLLF